MNSTSNSTEQTEIQRDLNAKLEQQRQAFQKEGQVSYETRLDRLDRCIALLVDKKDEICDALQEDFGCRSRYVTLMSEVMI